MSSILKTTKIHPLLLNTLQRVYIARNKVINNKTCEPQEIYPVFQGINFYQDGKGYSVLSKLDELFGIHESYSKKHLEQYQLLNTSLHDSIHLSLIDLLNIMNLEILDLVRCLETKKEALSKDLKRITHGLKIDTKLSSFYENYVNSLKSFSDEIKGLQTQLQNIPINSTFDSKNLKVDFGLEQKIYSELKNEFKLDNKFEEGNRIEKISNFKEIVEVSQFCSSLASVLMKFANDVRFLSSGPRSGFGEMVIPENEPGSSIMPGKVNPTQCEAMTMVCAQVLGNNNAVLIANSSSMFEGANFLPLMGNNTVRSANLLADAIRSFRKNCMEGSDFIYSSIEKEVKNFKI